jgi:putative oxidoreductase
MKWPVIIIRSLLGLAFLVLGLNHFLKFLDMGSGEELPDAAKSFVGGMGTGYMNVVKVLETTGGFLLLTGLYVPVGITLLTPVIVNILLWDVFIVKQPGPGIVLFALILFLIVGYWNHFKPVFTRHAKIGCC